MEAICEVFTCGLRTSCRHSKIHKIINNKHNPHNNCIIKSHSIRNGCYCNNKSKILRKEKLKKLL